MNGISVNFKILGMKKLKIYLLELRAPFLTATIVPVFLGAAVAFGKLGKFNLPLFLLALVGALLLHAGTNVINDYFDHKSGADWENKDFIFPFTGGSRLIQMGLLTPQEVLIEGIVLFSLALIVGAILTYLRGTFILVLGIIGLFSGIFYTAPPIFIAGRGLGELLVGINFGILMTVGSYYVQTMRVDLEPLLVSLPVAILVTEILYINQFPDAEADGKVGKNHLVVRLGKDRAIKVFLVLLLLTYVIIIAEVITKAVTPLSLVTFVTLPLAIKIVKVAKKNYMNSKALAPANASTIKLHLYVGILLVISYVLEGLI